MTVYVCENGHEAEMPSGDEPPLPCLKRGCGSEEWEVVDGAD